jgi:hypothetical protein
VPPPMRHSCLIMRPCAGLSALSGLILSRICYALDLRSRSNVACPILKEGLRY